MNCGCDADRFDSEPRRISSIEVFDMRMRKLQLRTHGIPGAAVVTVLLAACGGSSGTTAAAPGSGSNPPPAAITGLAMPTTVSVVTATNAN
jgi:hypothetical protein